MNCSPTKPMEKQPFSYPFSLPLSIIPHIAQIDFPIQFSIPTDVELSQSCCKIIILLCFFSKDVDLPPKFHVLQHPSQNSLRADGNSFADRMGYTLTNPLSDTKICMHENPLVLLAFPVTKKVLVKNVT